MEIIYKLKLLEFKGQNLHFLMNSAVALNSFLKIMNFLNPKENTVKTTSRIAKFIRDTLDVRPERVFIVQHDFRDPGIVSVEFPLFLVNFFQQSFFSSCMTG